MADRALIREGLALLGVERLVLGVHDASFPSLEDEDPGRGSPYSVGAERFLEFVAGLGFDGVQLGPQGMTHEGSASPYEATLFSRNPLNLPLARLRARGLLPDRLVEELVRGRPAGARERMDYSHVFAAFRPLLAALTPDRAAPLARFIDENAAWLLPDALYAPLCGEHGAPWYRQWEGTPQAALDRRLFAPLPGKETAARARVQALRARYSQEVERYAAVQLLLEDAHRNFRAQAHALGLSLYGDLQVGLSAQDEWARAALMLPGYRMGAPPSRTNPEGQPWGYPVLDPAQRGSLEAPGPALAFVRARVQRVARAYDGIRIDHPHGWVDPWVYRSDSDDPSFEVQNGARLFSSPAAPGHDALRAFAIALPDQLDLTRPRYADDHVRDLDDGQVAAYARSLDTLVDAARVEGMGPDALCFEVLSTLPHPVRRVLARHGLGRLRVLQKAKLDDPEDVYRPENAEPPDWVMLGTHDTPPIWRVVEDWRRSGKTAAWAEHLASRYASTEEPAEALAARWRSDDPGLVHALFAEALGSRARNVYVFFPDLFGQREIYNAPGTVGPENWSLRIPPRYEDAVALHLPRALALALRRVPGERARRVANALNGV